MLLGVTYAYVGQPAWSVVGTTLTGSTCRPVPWLPPSIELHRCQSWDSIYPFDMSSGTQSTILANQSDIEFPQDSSPEWRPIRVYLQLDNRQQSITFQSISHQDIRRSHICHYFSGIPLSIGGVWDCDADPDASPIIDYSSVADGGTRAHKLENTAAVAKQAIRISFWMEEDFVLIYPSLPPTWHFSLST